MEIPECILVSKATRAYRMSRSRQPQPGRFGSPRSPTILLTILYSSVRGEDSDCLDALLLSNITPWRGINIQNGVFSY
jgi:hypothetical protein